MHIIVVQAYIIMRIFFNFKLPVLKTHSSTMVSVVAFESEYPGSSPD